MSEECEKCEQVPPETEMEIKYDEFNKMIDKAAYGMACECSECGSRINPDEKVRFFRDETENDETKFLENESLTYGME